MPEEKERPITSDEAVDRAAHGSEVPTPRTDKWEYEQECNFDVSWEENCRELERETSALHKEIELLADGLRLAIWLAHKGKNDKSADWIEEHHYDSRLKMCEERLAHQQQWQRVRDAIRAAGLPNDQAHLQTPGK